SPRHAPPEHAFWHRNPLSRRSGDAAGAACAVLACGRRALACRTGATTRRPLGISATARRTQYKEARPEFHRMQRLLRQQNRLAPGTVPAGADQPPVVALELEVELDADRVGIEIEDAVTPSRQRGPDHD